MKTDRRTMIGGGLASVAMLTGCGVKLPKVTPPEFSPAGRFIAGLRKIEGEANGTLGAEFVDTASMNAVGLNHDARFGHCSSFKMSLAALVLYRDAKGERDADTRITWDESDLLSVSPFTTQRLSQGATLKELAEAAQKYSDNTAANILLREMGGPVALTAFWRSIGDEVSRLDRYEPQLNNVPITEYRDTTSPTAMAHTVAKLAYGDILPPDACALLRQWMADTQTGVRRVRAGIPELWVAGDKTGTSIWPDMGSLYVNIGFVEPVEGAPVTFATYFRTRKVTEGVDPEAEAVLARVGELLADFAKGKGAFIV